jgi:hypothetical protein
MIHNRHYELSSFRRLHHGRVAQGVHDGKAALPLGVAQTQVFSISVKQTP